jgi:hypothetical protein
VSSVVRPRTLFPLLALGMLFVAASWVDAGQAASPDPHPSAKKSQSPAPDTYPPPASTPSEPSVTETVTQPVIQVETTTVTQTPARTAPNDRSGARTQKKQARQPERTAAPAPKPRREPARLAVLTPPSNDGGPLLLGGLAMALLALASGSMLLLLTRTGNAGLRRWETKT